MLSKKLQHLGDEKEAKQGEGGTSAWMRNEAHKLYFRVSFNEKVCDIPGVFSLHFFNPL